MQTELQLRDLDVRGLGTSALQDLCVGLIPDQWTTGVWEPVPPCYIVVGGAWSQEPNLKGLILLIYEQGHAGFYWSCLKKKRRKKKRKAAPVAGMLRRPRESC